jgi:hypothetical protein
MLLGDEYAVTETQKLRNFFNTLFELHRLLQRMATQERKDQTRFLTPRDCPRRPNYAYLYN